MSSFTFSGIASGLDTATIVQQLVALRRAPIDRLESRIAGYQQRKSAYGDLETKLKTLLEKVQELDTPREYSSLAVTSGQEDLLTASAGYLAQQGSYSVTVNALATAQKERSQGFDSASDSVGTGTFTILAGGDTYNIQLEAGASSLSDLRFAINESDAPVTATILSDGGETGGTYLVLTAEETGTDAAFSIDASGLTGGTGPAFTNVAPAGNAEVIIDGLTVTSQTNSLASAIEGVTIELVGADPGTTFDLEVAVDPEGIREKVKAFVDAYNDLFGYVEQQRQDEATLRGDASLRSVVDRIQRVMTSALPSGDITMLYQVGVKQAEDGLLTFDEAAFTEAVAADYTGVRDLFVTNGDHQGTVSLLGLALEDMTDVEDGLLKISTDALDDRIETAETTIERYERSVEAYEERIKAQFTAMESLISSLSSQGSALASFTFLGES